MKEDANEFTVSAVRRKLRLITAFTGIILFLMVHKLPAQAPGNVTGGLIWWLKANAQAYTNNGTTLASDGQTIQRWGDQSSSNSDPIQTTNTNKPTYQSNQINGYPALYFAGDQFLPATAAPGVSSTNSFRMFIVLEQDAVVSGGIGDGNGTYIVDRTTETDNLMSLKITNGDKITYQKRNNDGDNLEGPVSVTSAPIGTYNIIAFGRTYNTSYDIYVDGRLDVTTTTNKGDQITGPRVQLGRHAVNTNQGLQGRIAEVILYNTALSTGNRHRIESYLALKYGITLDQTTLTDYVNSAGTIIYPAASNTGYSAYRYDIAGIGRDNNSALIQSSSKSQNSGSMVQISNPSSLGNGDFLIWGDNHGDVTAPNVTDVGGVIQARLSRVWRVAHTNNVGTVTMSIDMSNVPGSITGSDLRLLIDRDNDGFSDNDVTPRSGTLTGSSFVVTGVTLQNGDYFTVGSANRTSTPLPIELLDFTLEAQKDRIDVSWTVTIERNNDHFTVEKSVDGKQWINIGNVKSKGDTHTMQRYTLSDYNPATGLSYYRLSQTDRDGTCTTFSVKSVVVASSEDAVMVYPNPCDGSSIDLKLKEDASISLECVDIINQQGERIQHYDNSQLSANDQYHHLAFDAKLSSGFYYLKVCYNNRIGYFKIYVR